jgi:hypothetical protein
MDEYVNVFMKNYIIIHMWLHQSNNYTQCGSPRNLIKTNHCCKTLVVEWEIPNDKLWKQNILNIWSFFMDEIAKESSKS